jgi:hypothetical protein
MSRSYLEDQMPNAEYRRRFTYRKWRYIRGAIKLMTDMMMDALDIPHAETVCRNKRGAEHQHFAEDNLHQIRYGYGILHYYLTNGYRSRYVCTMDFLAGLGLAGADGMDGLFLLASHEVAHAWQTREGERPDGSSHNRAFYRRWEMLINRFKIVQTGTDVRLVDTKGTAAVSQPKPQPQPADKIGKKVMSAKQELAQMFASV